MEQWTWCHCHDREPENDLTLTTNASHLGGSIELKSCTHCGRLYRFSKDLLQVVYPPAPALEQQAS